ncbi:6-bladed beta-propeller [Dethiobacter alkaliphilus]|uniref:NHL repeat containing protein n=1 Tax=Dethiobacter alkaliphilus AHT 1 TaxID=555088 RepID=C0GG43_DETAL|nr:6-bladed beta-propeller [Dethiobacter alkaliphilus]EEG77732.1 NHL repeat containing protein [Dethiobacter alkaliphilus AHT 1]
MAVVDLREVKNNIAVLGQRKVKTVYLLLALSVVFSLLVIGWAFAVFLQHNAANAGLPGKATGEHNYQYAILGEGENMLHKPMGVLVSSGQVYVTDTMNKRVQVFSLSGNPRFAFGESGNKPGEFSFPYGIEKTSNGEIFVADVYNGNISVFDDRGNFLRYFAPQEKELTQPAGLFIHETSLYVSNLDPGQILVFDLETGELLRKIGSEGDGLGQLMFPNDAVIGPDGNLYVSDTGNNRIQVYTINGEFIETLNNEPLFSPRGIIFGPRGQLYVATKITNDITVLDETGRVTERFGQDLFELPNGIALDDNGFLYVTDYLSVSIFD